MKLLRIPLLILFCLTLGLSSAYGDDATARLDTLATQMEARTKTLNTLRELNQQKLKAHLQQLRADRAKGKAALDKSITTLNRLRKERAELTAEFKDASAAVTSLENEVRSGGAKVRVLLSESGITSLEEDRLAPLDALAESRAFPSVGTIEQMGAMLIEEIKKSGTAEVAKTTFLGPGGAPRQGRVLRVGSLFLGGVDQAGNGFLLRPGSTPPAAVANTPSAAEDAIISWHDGTTVQLPMDPSGGAALSLLQAKRTLEDWVQGGGLLLWPILLTGLLAVLIIIYKAARLLMLHQSPNNFAEELRTTWDDKRWEGVRSLLSSLSRVPAAKVLLRAEANVPPELRERQLQEGFLAEVRKLESLLGVVAVLAAVAPLLGLLGTVTGMIESFQAITFFASSNARVMAGGISEALITTQAGLGVAIPVMILHQLLKQRVQTLAGDMEQQCAALQALVANEDKTGGDSHD